MDGHHGVYARPVRETEIGEDNVGFEFGRSGRCLSNSLRTTHDDHVRMGIEELGQAVGDDLMVFHDHDANALALRARGHVPSDGRWRGSRPSLAKGPQFVNDSGRPATDNTHRSAINSPAGGQNPGANLRCRPPYLPPCRGLPFVSTCRSQPPTDRLRPLPQDLARFYCRDSPGQPLPSFLDSSIKAYGIRMASA